MNEEKVKEYFETKDALDQYQDILRARKLEFDKGNLALLNTIESKKEELTIIKKEVSDDAILEFSTTNTKKLYGGIGIRESETLEYEPTNAINWAKKHEVCLILDKRAFEKIAKTTDFPDIDFIVKIPKTTVTFPDKFKE